MSNSVFIDGNTLSPAEVMAVAKGSANEITQDSGIVLSILEKLLMTL